MAFDIVRKWLSGSSDESMWREPSSRLCWCQGLSWFVGIAAASFSAPTDSTANWIQPFPWIKDHQYILVLGSTFVLGLLQLWRLTLEPPIHTALLRAIFNDLQQCIFGTEQDMKKHEHRVTLYQFFPTKQGKSGNANDEGVLHAKFRSNHLKKKNIRSWRVSSEQGARCGIVGEAFSSASEAATTILRIPDAMMTNKKTIKECIKEYATATHDTIEEVTKRVDKWETNKRAGVPLPRFIVARPIFIRPGVDERPWGVLVIDSRRGVDFRADRELLYAIQISKFEVSLCAILSGLKS